MDYLTPDEIAAKLRIDITTVRRWLAAGQLPSIRVGRQYRIERSVFEAFLKSREVPPQEKDPKTSGLAFAS